MLLFSFEVMIHAVLIFFFSPCPLWHELIAMLWFCVITDIILYVYGCSAGNTVFTEFMAKWWFRLVIFRVIHPLDWVKLFFSGSMYYLIKVFQFFFQATGIFGYLPYLSLLRRPYCYICVQMSLQCKSVKLIRVTVTN